MEIKDKARILARLDQGERVASIAEDYKGIASVYTIQNLKADLKKENEKALALDALKVEPHILNHIVEESHKIEAPMLAKKMENAQESLTGLALLDSQFHKVMGRALTVADKLLKEEDISVPEWKIVTDTVANAYSSIFNSKGVSVNVNNSTSFSDTKLSMFKGSMRG